MNIFLSRMQKTPNAISAILTGITTGLLRVLLQPVLMRMSGTVRIPMSGGVLLTYLLPIALMKLLQRDLSVISIAIASVLAMGLAGAVLKLRLLEFISARPLRILLYGVLFTAFFYALLLGAAKLARLQSKKA